ncbi:MAG: cytochrome c oxidase assembly protein [Alphaproteobacteria bacterium]|nr:cytochrome c oxidase assembly protein [Alphaproteobacteria bacterium]
MARKMAVSRNTRWVAICVTIVGAMLAVALNAAPLYAAFCKVTGFGGTTQTATKAPGLILDKSIEVRFDVNVPPGTPLEFRTAQTSETLRIGETGIAHFTVKNLSDRPVKAIASYNVTPHTTGIYFQKLQCFCFEDMVFQPGQTLDLPVIYFIDPDIVKNRDTRDVHTITLSYTYYEQAGG